MSQYITEDKGNRTHVVIAVKEYNRLIDIAEKAGVSKPYISMIESRRRTPSVVRADLSRN